MPKVQQLYDACRFTFAPGGNGAALSAETSATSPAFQILRMVLDSIEPEDVGLDEQGSALSQPRAPADRPARLAGSAVASAAGREAKGLPNLASSSTLRKQEQQQQQQQQERQLPYRTGDGSSGDLMLFSKDQASGTGQRPSPDCSSLPGFRVRAGRSGGGVLAACLRSSSLQDSMGMSLDLREGGARGGGGGEGWGEGNTGNSGNSGSSGPAMKHSKGGDGEACSAREVEGSSNGAQAGYGLKVNSAPSSSLPSVEVGGSGGLAEYLRLHHNKLSAGSSLTQSGVTGGRSEGQSIRRGGMLQQQEQQAEGVGNEQVRRRVKGARQPLNISFEPSPPPLPRDRASLASVERTVSEGLGLWDLEEASSLPSSRPRKSLDGSATPSQGWRRRQYLGRGGGSAGQICLSSFGSNSADAIPLLEAAGLFGEEAKVLAEKRTAAGGGTDARLGSGAALEQRGSTAVSAFMKESAAEVIAPALLPASALMQTTLEHLAKSQKAAASSQDSTAFPVPAAAPAPAPAPLLHTAAPPITYLHVYGCREFSIGIFCLPKNASIPLHDHPGMTVLSRLLVGSMHLRAYDWVDGDSAPSATLTSAAIGDLEGFSTGGTVGGDTSPRLARLVEDTFISAPHCPSEVLFARTGGNIHSFTAITPCAVLDVLAPPYDATKGRNCTYYREAKWSQPQLSALGLSLSDGEDFPRPSRCPKGRCKVRRRGRAAVGPSKGGEGERRQRITSPGVMPTVEEESSKSDPCCAPTPLGGCGLEDWASLPVAYKYIFSEPKGKDKDTGEDCMELPSIALAASMSDPPSPTHRISAPLPLAGNPGPCFSTDGPRLGSAPGSLGPLADHVALPSAALLEQFQPPEDFVVSRGAYNGPKVIDRRAKVHALGGTHPSLVPRACNVSQSLAAALALNLDGASAMAHASKSQQRQMHHLSRPGALFPSLGGASWPPAA